MVITDTIGDLIIRLKNGNRVGKDTVSVRASKLKSAVAEALVRAGFVKSVSAGKGGAMLDIELAYGAEKTPRIAGVARVSKPSRRVYMPVSEIRPFKGGFGALILSTPAGILSDKEAIKAKAGGEALFRIW
ncbi:MAG: 30S ribosomal protein S8 [Patescibacteria group bacterium]|nr:30S ribosomal protein S8 [Patescibacteria group bacterium]MDE1945833.1 30S ribosomal protein S8 [Patescibacteria group bacterium]